MTPLLWALLILGVAALGVAALAIAIAQANRRDNEVVPDVVTRAPRSWAGAHTPEARLHRRLRDSVRSVRTATEGRTEAHTDLRVTLERQAVALDEQLVAVAALPERLRTGPLAEADAAVTALEDAAAALVQRSTAAPDATTVDAVTERLRLLEEARVELDRSVPPAGMTQAPGPGHLRTGTEPGPGEGPTRTGTEQQDPGEGRTQTGR
jgi:hypothetical protein